MLIKFCSQIEPILKVCFHDNREFADAQRDGLEYGLNAFPDVSPKIFAKYFDYVLRKSDKETVEPEAIDQEKVKAIGAALELFRFIQGKDLFHSVYQRCLAQRLLDFRTVAKEEEFIIINHLQTICGPLYTQELEAMFADIDNSKVIHSKFAKVLLVFLKKFPFVKDSS